MAVSDTLYGKESPSRNIYQYITKGAYGLFQCLISLKIKEKCI